MASKDIVGVAIVAVHGAGTAEVVEEAIGEKVEIMTNETRPGAVTKLMVSIKVANVVNGDIEEAVVDIVEVKTSALREKNSSKKSVQLKKPELQPNLALKDCVRTAAKIVVIGRIKRNK